MSTYAEKLKDPRWQKVRLKVMERDGFACRDCGDKTKTLQVHHCHYAKGAPWNTPLDFLLTVCCDCHPKRAAVEEAIRMPLLQLLADTDLKQLEEVAERIAAGDTLLLMHKSQYAHIEAAAKNLREAFPE